MVFCQIKPGQLFYHQSKPYVKIQSILILLQDGDHMCQNAVALFSDTYIGHESGQTVYIKEHWEVTLT